jgi:hypothetical protein
MTLEFHQADCLTWMREQPADRFDLVCGSPPYLFARTYGLSKAEAWWNTYETYVTRMLEITTEAARVCRGPVIWVVGCPTRKRNYHPAAEAMMVRWFERGGTCELYRPCFFHRVGIPGSGGKDWFRADTEYVLCFKRPGALPWSNNTAHGHRPKWAPGGEMSYRNSKGTRRNQWGAKAGGSASRNAAGKMMSGERPSHVVTSGRDQWGQSANRVEPSESQRRNGKRSGYLQHAKDGTVKGSHDRDICAIANPGNVWKIAVGGGLMGSALAHENEAPYPESLVERIVLATCPPGGWVLDPFSGSGTTAAVCQRFGRNCVGLDIRESQVELSRRRCAEIQRMLVK